MFQNKKLNPDKPFYLQFAYFISYLFSFEVLPFLLAFSFSFIFFPINIYIFIIINLLATMMAFKIGFDALAGCSRGEHSPKVMHNSVVSNGVAIKVFAVFLIQIGVEFLLEKKGVALSKIETVNSIFIIITPAIYMFIAMTNSLTQALNPYALFRLISKFPITYLLIVGFWLLTKYSVDHLFPSLIFHLPIFLSGMILLFLEFGFLIMTFHIMGFALYQNRVALGLEDSGSEQQRQDDLLYLRIKRLANEGELQEAMLILQDLKNEGDDSTELLEIEKNLKELSRMHIDAQLSREAHIHQLLELGKAHSALSETVLILNEGKGYKAHDVTDYFKLAKYAHDHSKHKLAGKLIEIFNLSHSRHPLAVNMGFLKAQIMYANKESLVHIRGLLKGLIKNFPNHPQIDRVKSWLIGLDKIKRQ